jgi:UDP-glucose 4-epimerase
MNIMITGGNGYIAKSVSRDLAKVHDVVSVTRKDFDMEDCESMGNWFEDKHFDVVIHTAVVGGSRLKVEDPTVTEKNLRMHYNLVANRKRFDRLITFGSGAEIFSPDTPYGMSKKIIANSIRTIPNWYNIRVFAVFDENELNTRFIKANITRNLRGESMRIHMNKVMDFFYMQDLVSLVKFYISHDSPPKEVDCSYVVPLTLVDIANKINDQSRQRTEIILENEGIGEPYRGDPSRMPIDTLGIDVGIRETYCALEKMMGVS